LRESEDDFSLYKWTYYHRHYYRYFYIPILKIAESKRFIFILFLTFLKKYYEMAGAGIIVDTMAVNNVISPRVGSMRRSFLLYVGLLYHDLVSAHVLQGNTRLRHRQCTQPSLVNL